jgi:hypothetical protein
MPKDGWKPNIPSPLLSLRDLLRESFALLVTAVYTTHVCSSLPDNIASHFNQFFMLISPRIVNQFLKMFQRVSSCWNIFKNPLQSTSHLTATHIKAEKWASEEA